MGLDPRTCAALAQSIVHLDRIGLADLQVAGDQEQDVGPPLRQGAPNLWVAYLSTVSPKWRLDKQAELLDEYSLTNRITPTFYRDELKLRRGQHLSSDMLRERAVMLRPTTRAGRFTILVASIAVLATNADDFLVVLARAAEHGASICDIHTGTSSPPAKHHPTIA
jgi:hypothetical protein